MRPEPLSPYAVDKLAAEGYLRAYHHCYGLGVLPLRFFNVFGPLQPADHAYAAVVPAFLTAALAGRPVTVHGDGGQTRDFVYVGTVAQVLCTAVLRRVVDPEPVNVALGTGATLLELIAELGEVLGRPLDVAHTEPRAGDVRDSVADSTRLRELFPDLAPVPLREGLAGTARWLRTQQPQPQP